MFPEKSFMWLMILENVEKLPFSNFLHLQLIPVKLEFSSSNNDMSIKKFGWKYSQTESLAKVYQFFFADLNWKSLA